MSCAWASEDEFMRHLIVALSASGIGRVYRQNAGAIKTTDETTGKEYFVTLAPAGAADISGILRGGRRIEVECKKGRTDKQRKAQKEWQAMIESWGGVYVVVHGGMGIDGAMSAIRAACL